MSFRELRNFTEIMRSLGYPRLVSMENFRTPNFELVADCLYWLAMRYDPAAADISDDISTERDRVAFLKATAHFMLQRAHIKLNIKRLYAADGYAVKELLKIASVLYASAGDDDEAGDDLNEFTFNAKMFDAKVTRALTSEITQRGAVLYDALEREPELKEARMRAVGRNMDIDDIERAVREAIAAVGENVANVEATLANLQKDEKSLEQKIEKRQAELERGEKRLSTLQSVRPAYMDDYEKLQVDLQALYVVYLERFRNLEYLESQLERHRRAEQERVEETERELKRMQKRLREEELRILRGEAQVDEANIEGDVYRPASEGSGDEGKRKGKKKGSKHVKGKGTGQGKVVVGSWVAGACKGCST
eukprot:jgi/Mesvir1/11093/Mv02464-RA.2